MTNIRKLFIGMTFFILTGVLFFGILTKPDLSNNDSLGISSSSGESGKADFKDGEYFGEANGYGGPIKVKVIIEKGKIKDITIVSHSETPEYLNMAKGVIKSIIDKGNLDVDSVSGATISSNAIKKAVADALKDAVLNEEFKIAVKEDPEHRAVGKRAPSVGLGSDVTSVVALGENQQLRDGTYTGVGTGYNGPIKVSVTISNGQIVDIAVVSHSDDRPFFSKATRLIPSLLGSPGKNVDAVGGATFSSRGIISAVNNAVSKAIGNKEEVAAVTEQDAVNTQIDEEPNTMDNDSDQPNNQIDNSEASEFYIKDNLKDGVYEGWGRGYRHTKGKIRTLVTVKDSKIVDIAVEPNKKEFYADDTDFHEIAFGGIEYLKNDNWRNNLSHMMLYQKYIFELQSVSKDNLKEEIGKKFGEKYASKLGDVSGLRGNRLREKLSGIVKLYIKDQTRSKDMLDSVSGATFSFGGISEGINDAIKKAIVNGAIEKP